MEFLAMMFLVLVTALLILGPLVRRQEASPDRSSLPQPDPDRAKASALGAIRELEFDYQTGKISPEDYAQLRGRYEAKAVEAISRPAPSPRADLETRIEAEIKAARAKRYCTSCGQSLSTSARFCPACGTPAFEVQR